MAEASPEKVPVGCLSDCRGSQAETEEIVTMVGLKRGALRIGKYRLAFGYFIGVVCLALAREELFLPGVAIAFSGIAFRLWSAGCIDKNRCLAMGGPYALCRNPLYLGSFIMGIGAVLAVRVWWLLVVYVIGFAVFYWPTILREERALAAKFGDEYSAYRGQVPSFVPRKVRLEDNGFSISNVLRNREHLYALASLAFLVLLEAAEELRSFFAHHGGL
ncbi:MAG TPA: isoprenylcysteine carboxylmethyltransferase family protein [Armatimonadota bacterium]|nr:isoprenylcysteine carboxylmethyltransferase family protein [Armatimonadota bacterium]